MLFISGKFNFKTGDTAMAKAQCYSMEQIQAAQKNLRCLAAKKVGKTKAETVEFLAGDIRKAVEQGYSLKEIQDTLAKAGIAAPLSRMRGLFGQADDKAARTDTPMRETKAGGVPETPVTDSEGKEPDAELPGIKKAMLFEL
jgi:hypothetical protein